MNIFSNFFRRLFRRPKKSAPQPVSSETAEPLADTQADVRRSRMENIRNCLPEQEGAGSTVVQKPPVDTNSDFQWSMRGARSGPAIPVDVPWSGELETWSAFASRPPTEFVRRVQQGIRDSFGGNPVPFYRAADLSRSAYSRMISHPEYHPSKDTVLAMAAAFRLSLAEAESFLHLAGYALSSSILSDVVWRKCFEHGLHDLPKIRALLDRYA